MRKSLRQLDLEEMPLLVVDGEEEQLDLEEMPLLVVDGEEEQLDLEEMPLLVVDGEYMSGDTLVHTEALLLLACFVTVPE